MKEDRQDTRQTIIDAACELFALRGLDGTGVRAIVQAAGTALSSVNYHFENKEQLYEQCIRYIVHDELKLEALYDDFETAEYQSIQDVSDAVYRLIRTLFHLLLSPETPKWYGILLIRAKHECHSETSRLLDSITSPERMKNFLVSHIPDLSDKEAFFWIFSLTGQLQHYIVSKPTVLKMFNMDEYTPDFIEAVVNYASLNQIQTLGLPEPRRDEEPA